MALIEDSELEQLRRKAALADQALPSKQLLDKLGKNPKTRGQILQLMKEDNPDLVIPEIDAAKPFLDKLTALEQQLESERKARAEKEKEESQKRAKNEIEEVITKGRKRLRDSGWTDEGIKNVETLMTDRGLTDYDAAAALWEKEHPAEEPIMPSNFGRDSELFNPPADNPWKDVVKLPKTAADRAMRNIQNKEINAWLAERNPRQRVRA